MLIVLLPPQVVTVDGRYGPTPQPKEGFEVGTTKCERCTTSIGWVTESLDSETEGPVQWLPTYQTEDLSVMCTACFEDQVRQAHRVFEVRECLHLLDVDMVVYLLTEEQTNDEIVQWLVRAMEQQEGHHAAQGTTEQMILHRLAELEPQEDEEE